MNNVRRTVITFALSLAVALASGCTFGMFPRESHDPARAALPPCYSGDVCGVGFDSGFLWMRDTVQSAGR